MAAGPDTSPARRGAGSLFLRMLVVLIIGVVVAVALLIAIPPAGLIKDQIERAASAATGRNVTIGNAGVNIWPLPSVALTDVAVANPDGISGLQLLQAQSINARLKLKPLLSGKAEIESLEIVKPQVNLIKDAAGKTNWSFPGSGLASGPQATLINGATIKDGVIIYTAAGAREPLRLEKVDATIAPDGAVSATGALNLGGESAAFSILLKDALALSAGKPSEVKFAIDGKHLQGEISGLASNVSSPELTGDIAMQTGSLRDLARWLGWDVTAGPAPLTGSVTGKIKASASSVTFDGTNFAAGADAGQLTGKLGLDGPRPRYEGSIVTSRIDVDALLGRTAMLQNSAAPEAEADLELDTAPAWDGLRDTLQGLSAQPSAGAAPETRAKTSAPAKPSTSAGWSEAPIDLKILQSADIDAVITSDTVVLGKLDLKNAQIKTKLVDGKLDANIEKLAVGTGSATGKLSLDGSKAVPHADVALNLVNVAAEPIITEITGKPLLNGTSNVDITATGDGRNQLALASSLEGKAKFRMSKGSIRGFDVRSIMSNWWNSLTGGLKFDISKKTGFEKLDAQYDIKRGVMTSSPGLDIGGNEVEVQSRGNVSLPARLINQQIRVKMVPPPAAPPIPVTITGSWAKPSISMNWGDLLFSSGVAAASAGATNEATAAPSAAPEAVTATDNQSIAKGFQDLAPKPEEIPDDVKAKIESVLASDQAKAITPEGKALLQTLLAPTQGAPAEPVTDKPTEPQAPQSP